MQSQKSKGGRPRMYDPKRPPKLIGVHVPEPVHRILKREAAGLGISLSELVRLGLFAGLPFLQPPAKMPSSGVRQLIR